MSIVVLYPFDDNSTVEIINEAFLKIYIDLKNNTRQVENTVDSFKEGLKKAVLHTCIAHRKKYGITQIMAGADPGESPVSVEYRAGR